MANSYLDTGLILLTKEEQRAKGFSNSAAAALKGYDWTPSATRKPTKTAVGSAERIAVYIRRVELGEELHHPDDNRVAGRKTPVRSTQVRQVIY